MWKIHRQQWEGQVDHFLQKTQNGLIAGLSEMLLSSFSADSRISFQGIDPGENRS
jgi:type IV secretory pathway TrbF-like protein